MEFKKLLSEFNYYTGKLTREISEICFRPLPFMSSNWVNEKCKRKRQSANEEELMKDFPQKKKTLKATAETASAVTSTADTISQTLGPNNSTISQTLGFVPTISDVALVTTSVAASPLIEINKATETLKHESPLIATTVSATVTTSIAASPLIEITKATETLKHEGKTLWDMLLKFRLKPKEYMCSRCTDDAVYVVSGVKKSVLCLRCFIVLKTNLISVAY